SQSRRRSDALSTKRKPRRRQRGSASMETEPRARDLCSLATISRKLADDLAGSPLALRPNPEALGKLVGFRFALVGDATKLLGHTRIITTSYLAKLSRRLPQEYDRLSDSVDRISPSHALRIVQTRFSVSNLCWCNA